MMKYQRQALKVEPRTKAPFSEMAGRIFLAARSPARCAGSSQLASGFTLLETLVAVTLLSIAIVAPMSLTSQSLNSAYYARDQITASYLAQEGLEAVRSIRDANILKSSLDTSVDLLAGIPINVEFRIDARDNARTPCSADGATCIALQTDALSTLYGYNSGWTATKFKRTLIACFVQDDGSCSGTPVTDEIKVTVTVTWTSGGLAKRTITVSENMYRWIKDGSASAG